MYSLCLFIIMPMRFIYGVASNSNSFSFYFFQWTNPFCEYTIIPSTIDEHLNGFQFRVIMNKAKNSWFVVVVVVVF